MREKFIQYHISEYKEELFKDARIILDTNSLLNLYKYNEDSRQKYFEILEKIKDRMVIPYHVCQEFYKNRDTLIQNRVNFKKDIKEEISQSLSKMENRLESGTDKPALTTLRYEDDLKQYIIDKIKTTERDIVDKIEEFEDNITEKYIYDTDPILDKIVEIFEGRANEKISEIKLEEIYKLGEERYENNIPPGYKDSKKGSPEKFGDLIIWKEIMKIGKDLEKDVLFISDDRKEDWVHKFNGKDLGPRKELINEFYKETGKMFYSINTKDFIKEMSLIYEIKDTESLERENELIQQKIDKENKYSLLNKERSRNILNNIEMPSHQLSQGLGDDLLGSMGDSAKLFNKALGGNILSNMELPSHQLSQGLSNDLLGSMGDSAKLLSKALGGNILSNMELPSHQLSQGLSNDLLGSMGDSAKLLSKALGGNILSNMELPSHQLDKGLSNDLLSSMENSSKLLKKALDNNIEYGNLTDIHEK